MTRNSSDIEADTNKREQSSERSERKTAKENGNPFERGHGLLHLNPNTAPPHLIQQNPPKLTVNFYVVFIFILEEQDFSGPVFLFMHYSGILLYLLAKWRYCFETYKHKDKFQRSFDRCMYISGYQYRDTICNTYIFISLQLITQ